MKYIVVVPDGMADEPLAELNGKTPQEAANTTNMDFMAKKGCVGTVKTVPENMHPGSDVANFSLLGYSPQHYLSGRAPLEAANMDIELSSDEIAFRCNLVTIQGQKMEDYSAGHIRSEEAAELIRALNENLQEDGIRFYPGKSYRHLLVIKAHNAKEYLGIEATPPHDIMNQDFQKYLPKGTNSALLLKLMEKSRNVLADHPVNKVRIDLQENPANMIWLWGQGQKPQIPQFFDKFGLKGGIISAVDLVNGIGKLAGLEVVSVPGITGYYDTNYLGKAEYALKTLQDKDFVFIHVEAPDEAGHNGDIKEKIAAIERIDREILGTILNHFSEQGDVRILVAPDHPTPVALRTHTSEPVCFLMYGKNIISNDVNRYTEKDAKTSERHYQSGEEMMYDFIKKNI